MINVAVIQSAFREDAKDNCQKIIGYIEEAKKNNAQVVLPPELFLSKYFCKNQDDKFFDLAHEVDSHPYLEQIKKICRKLSVVVPCSFFEKSGPHYFNSLAMIDATGDILGIYRKSHIPDGPGYQEKYYFRPGNTGFKVFATKYGRIGAGICWDQWFPECARAMALMGADILCYPTAIGSEPNAPDLNTKEPWQRVMIGHSVANMTPVVAANRVGLEDGQSFYGASFIANEFGDKILQFGEEEGVKTVAVDTKAAQKNRASFGFFRDRRPDLYGQLLK